MWIFMPDGALSVVAHRHKPAILLVRSRERAILERLANDLTAQPGVAGPPPVLETPDADYAFRLEAHRGAFGAWIAREAHRIDWDNFKARADVVGSRPYAGALHRIWRVLWEALAPVPARTSTDWWDRPDPEDGAAPTWDDLEPPPSR